MSYGFRYSPFIAFSNGIQQVGQHSLDRLGTCSLGELYWNNGINGFGLVCGAVEDETGTVVRRLLASHLDTSTAKVLILHCDHFSVAGTPCSLLPSSWPQPRILVSPQASQRVIDSYSNPVARITFQDSSITLRHVLALFTPPQDMPGSSTILSTVQFILSQMQEPFDPQRFSELVDTEKWSEDGQIFMALRQTLLTKLLSPGLDDDFENDIPQITLVDLTDPVLASTGLDSPILDLALHGFIRHGGEKKIIVLNNCEQYLTPTSSLSKSLEALASAGSGRSTSILLSTTDPNTLSPRLITSLQYAIFTSSHWNEFIRAHLCKAPISNGQHGFRKATIWSPGSSLYVTESAMDETTIKKSWNELMSFIDIDQFEETVPASTPASPPANMNVSGMVPEQPASAESTKSIVPTGDATDEEGEANMSLGTSFMQGSQDSTSFPRPSSTVQHEPEKPANEPTQPNPPPPKQKVDHLFKFNPLLVAVSQLCDGEVGILVDFEAVRKQAGYKKEEIKKLGWTTFTHMVKDACINRLLEQIEAQPGGSKLLSLLPLSIDVMQSHMASPAPYTQNGTSINTVEYTRGSKKDASGSSSQPDVNHTPEQSQSSPTQGDSNQYTALITAILTLSCGLAEYRIPLTKLKRNMEGQMNAAMEQFGWSSIENWLYGACLEGYVAQGKTDGFPWVMATIKALEAKQENDLQQEIVNNTHKAGKPTNDAIGTSSGNPNPNPESSSKPLAGSGVGQHDSNSSASGKFGSSGYSSKHRPVIIALLRLIGDESGLKIRMLDLLAALKRDYPNAKDEFLFKLVSDAEKDNSLICEKDQAGVFWISFSDKANFPVDPSVTSTPAPVPATPTGTSPLPLQGDTRSFPDQNTSQEGKKKQIEVADYPVRHRPVVAAMFKLTGGNLETKTRIVDVNATLRQEFRNAREETLNKFIHDAEEDGILGREIGRADVVWVILRGPSTQGAPGLLTPNPSSSINSPLDQTKYSPLPTSHGTNPSSPHPASLSSTLIPEPWQDGTKHPPTSSSPGNASPQQQLEKIKGSDYALEYRIVASTVIKLTGGFRGAKVRMTDLEHSLQNENPRANRPFLIQRAIQDNVLLREVDGTVVWVSLQNLSKPNSNQLIKTSSHNLPAPVPPLSPHSNDYPLAHRPLVSAMLRLTNGRCHVRVKMEAVIKALMTDPTANIRDPSMIASVVFEAADAMVVTCRKEDKIWWTYLEEPVAPDSRRYTSMNPNKAEHVASPRTNPNSNPTAHRAVVSAIQRLNGGDTRRSVSMQALNHELCQMGEARNVQGAMMLVTAATSAGVARVLRDEEGERSVVLTT